MQKTIVLAVLCFVTIHVLAQNALNKNILPLKQEEGMLSIAPLQPMIDEMGRHKIVGLGEGTHGTKAFNDLRISIIKELVEKKGFRIICLENAFGDCYYFNEVMRSRESIKDGMKKYLLSLWQTREMEELFTWIRTYNESHSEKVSISGMDFNYLTNSAKIMTDESGNLKLHPLITLSDDLYRAALSYDAIWDNQMKGLDRDAWIAQLKHLKSKLQGIDSIIKADNLPVSDLFQTALLSIKSWSTGEGNRDKSMAQMAVRIAKDNKTIIWAHAVHLALKSAFNDNSVGGCGGYIKQQVPEYYVLGTGTATGQYGGFEDRFDTRINVMKRFDLPEVKNPSWDDYFMQQKLPAFFINLRNVKNDTTTLPLRLVGYGPPKRMGYSDALKLSELFDGYLFIKKTSAPEYLP
ncbi:erythromycin esterase family protein [Niabella sp.]|uniref:erythromycin esterase family protein n=1 Tax=Niabella sp. TaxID=1962976 RepID=UPI0026391456|nr:erythromycin esterase family protein [Niabella sp.]